MQNFEKSNKELILQSYNTGNETSPFDSDAPKGDFYGESRPWHRHSIVRIPT